MPILSEIVRQIRIKPGNQVERVEDIDPVPLQFFREAIIAGPDQAILDLVDTKRGADGHEPIHGRAIGHPGENVIGDEGALAMPEQNAPRTVRHAFQIESPRPQ